MSTFTQTNGESRSRTSADGYSRADSPGHTTLHQANSPVNSQREMLTRSPKVQSQIQLHQMLNDSPRVVAQAKLAESMNSRDGLLQRQRPVQRQAATEDEELTQQQASLEEEEPLQGKLAPLQREEMLEDDRPLQPKPESVRQKKNSTGLPENLKAGVENLSGLSMDDVKVHYNSPAPATVQALAYTQGTDIHVGPGQEQHLAHEAWHVAQQKQGRVKPTMQAKGVAINDERSLETEADVMGERALQANGNSLQRMKESISEPTYFQPGAQTIQRLTVAYTTTDLVGGNDATPFAGQVIQTIIHARASIPNHVKAAVDAFGDCPAAGTYKHHVPYGIMLDRIITLCEGETRDTIVDWMTNSVEAVGVDPATFGVDPMLSVAAFNTWLDSAIVAICDWPDNIFRGASAGDAGGTALDAPTAPSAALTLRLTNAVATLTGLNVWP